MTKIYIDLETIPAQSEQAIFMLKEQIEEKISKLKAPGNYGEVKAAEYIAKKRAELEIGYTDLHLKTSFDGRFGEIINIGYKINDGELSMLSRKQGDPEAPMLKAFFDLLADNLILKGGSIPKVQWIGHNLIKFDLPFLFKRCVINNINPGITIPIDARHGLHAYDTALGWSGYGNYISQDNLCKTLGLKTKQGMDGSKVYQAWLDGKYDEISEYCKNDVQTVFDLYNRLNFII